MSRHCAGPKIRKSESSLNHFHKVMLPLLMFNYNYYSYLISNNLKKNIYLNGQSKKIMRCRDISKTKIFLKTQCLGFFLLRVVWYKNMINSCDGTSIKATLLCGNDLERFLILVFVVLRDVWNFFLILYLRVQFY